MEDELSSENERRCQGRWSVSLEGANLTLVRETDGRWEYEEGRLLDVSPRGVRFQTMAAVDEGERQRLLLQPTDPAAVTATVDVRILWTRRLESGSREIGAEILSINGTPPPDESDTKESETMTNHLEQDRQMAAHRLAELLKTEHWLGNFISALLSTYDLNGVIEFATTEKLLSTEKEEFERDLAIARKMLTLYPGLLQKQPETESKPEPKGEPTQPQASVAAP